jgi:thermitase
MGPRHKRQTRQASRTPKSRAPQRPRAKRATPLALVLCLSLLTAMPSRAAGASPSDPASAGYISKQWGLVQIHAQAAWAFGKGAGVRIGIVDTGVDLGHADLAGKVVAAATCMGTGGNPGACKTGPGAGQDDNGHGTHVAGIAAASGIGVAGVAPAASLVVAKVLNSSGAGSTADVAAGIGWVVEHGAKVVNLSLGSDPGFLGVNCLLGGCDSGTVTAAVEAAWRAGAVAVVAAGNNAGDLFGPAGYGGLDAVVVAATGPEGHLASDYSSLPGDAKWGVLAPGGDDPAGPTTPTCGTFDPTEILSTYWAGGSCYATDEGTSMATPFVSGTIALLLGRGLSQVEAVQTLLSTLGPPSGCDSAQGCRGLVDAASAMSAAARGTASAAAANGGSPAAVSRPTPAVGSSTPPAGTVTGPSTDPTSTSKPISPRPAREVAGTSPRSRQSSTHRRGAGSPLSPLVLALVGMAALVVPGSFLLRRSRRTRT